MLKTKGKVNDLPGFEDVENEEAEQTEVTPNAKKKKKSSGGFQGMGFSFPIMKGITKRGYKQPTPIQRKAIPIALNGKDLVAMARTGSGKTACFVLPILEKLIAPAKTAAGKQVRALILSPTRELALQTLRFVRELGKFAGLTSAAILGGESLEQQFSVMSGQAPDIVVATPGRFLHICVEMSLKLEHIKVVVFDEADRLFELGFGEQLREIVSRLPSSRQTLLFSATLPKMIVEFARAGLSDPVLVRLDVDWKLPSTLWLGWVAVRAELRTAALLLLLDRVLTDTAPQAVVFAATKHHVEYLHLVLQRAGITSTYAYSGLDPSARKIALGRFMNKKCSVLIVTDVAARGLDLPSLDTVINYNFPAKPKLFVHRVGRSARAGRAGRAWSLVAAEDAAHLLDLQLFLGATLATPDQVQEAGPLCPSGVWGALPAAALEMRHQELARWEQESSEIEDALRVCGRGWQQYLRWREPASAAANKRAKATPPPALTHPFLLAAAPGPGPAAAAAAEQMRASIGRYNPRGTILELTAKSDSPMYLAMKAKKLKHGALVARAREAQRARSILEPLDIADRKQLTPKRKKEVVRDENYIPHAAGDQHTELGMAVNFNASASAAELDLGTDTGEGARQRTNQQRWDRKRKKMVNFDADGGKKMIRTESGGRIPATFRSGRYEDWRRRHARDDRDDGEPSAPSQGRPVSEFRPHWVKHNERIANTKAAGSSREFKDKQQIVKARLRKEKLQARLKHKKGGKGKGKGKVGSKGRKSK